MSLTKEMWMWLAIYGWCGFLVVSIASIAMNKRWFRICEEQRQEWSALCKRQGENWQALLRQREAERWR